MPRSINRTTDETTLVVRWPILTLTPAYHTLRMLRLTDNRTSCPIIRSTKNILIMTTVTVRMINSQFQDPIVMKAMAGQLPDIIQLIIEAIQRASNTIPTLTTTVIASIIRISMTFTQISVTFMHKTNTIQPGRIRLYLLSEDIRP